MRTYINNVNDFRDSVNCRKDSSGLNSLNDITAKNSSAAEILSVENLINKTLNFEQRFSPFRRTLGLHKQLI
ncbi:MAG: hypothetical protein CVV24_05100 [Ignavibacteriae bacterium HGW-Ignavibacteriae-3]|nr:MAG: hypothetical protein CVV24_05100 [Ignavibacteriae bacterium HGW-Ignavibacteriae-3]